MNSIALRDAPEGAHFSIAPVTATPMLTWLAGLCLLYLLARDGPFRIAGIILRIIVLVLALIGAMVVLLVGAMVYLVTHYGPGDLFDAAYNALFFSWK